MDIFDPFHMMLHEDDHPADLLPADIAYAVSTADLVSEPPGRMVRFMASSPRVITDGDARVIQADAGYPRYWCGCRGFRCDWEPNAEHFIAIWECWDDYE